MLAITIEINGSGKPTTTNATELPCLDEIQDKISGEATIRIVLVQGKITDTAIPAATIDLRISIETENSAWPNRQDITEDVPGATLKVIRVLSSIRLRVAVTRLWRNRAGGQAMISATMKMRSQGEFILVSFGPSPRADRRTVSFFADHESESNFLESVQSLSFAGSTTVNI